MEEISEGHHSSGIGDINTDLESMQLDFISAGS